MSNCSIDRPTLPLETYPGHGPGFDKVGTRTPAAWRLYLRLIIEGHRRQIDDVTRELANLTSGDGPYNQFVGLVQQGRGRLGSLIHDINQAVGSLVLPATCLDEVLACAILCTDASHECHVYLKGIIKEVPEGHEFHEELEILRDNLKGTEIKERPFGFPAAPATAA